MRFVIISGNEKNDNNTKCCLDASGADENPDLGRSGADPVLSAAVRCVKGPTGRCLTSVGHFSLVSVSLRPPPPCWLPVNVLQGFRLHNRRAHDVLPLYGLTLHSANR